MKIIKESRCFDGILRVYQHASTVVGCEMQFAIFHPCVESKSPTSMLLFLAGLTSTWENAPTKLGAFKRASELNMAMVFPDTSPRGKDVYDVEDYAIGQGAGYYLSATKAPWAQNYKMDTYITDELLDLITSKCPDINTGECSICGFSMGGLGALSLGIKNPELFRTLSAFSPITSLTHTDWGKKAIDTYFEKPDQALDFDPCHLITEKGYARPILIDQGSDDEFLNTGLLPQKFADACAQKGVSLNLRMRSGFDHSYYFTSTFINEHLDFASGKKIS